MLYKRTVMLSLLLLTCFTILSSCDSDQPATTKETEKEFGKSETTEAIETAESNAMVPIPLELPPPHITYSFNTIRLPDGKLEKPRDKPREPFLATVGVTNVARGKQVFSSEKYPIVGEIEFITDGNKNSSKGSYVDLGPFLQHVTIDLEREYKIYAIVVWHFHAHVRAYKDVVVQVADDADFVTNVRTLFNNDHDNSAGLGVGDDWHYAETFEGKLIDAKGEKARYVRLFSNGNSSGDCSQYIEVEVFGK